ncbi:MAG: cytochrome c biogenesis protein CcdA [Patescibacteria group bacterium]
MKSKLTILIIIAATLIGSALLLGNTSFSSRWLWNLSDGGKLMLPLVAIAALIDSVNPCAFSILLLTIAFLFSLGKARTGILKIGGSYIFGLFAIYILIGLGILQTLHIFNTPHFMAKVGATLLLVLGFINLINYYFPAFPIKLKIPQAAHHKMAALMEKASAPTAFLLGGLVGLCEFPCTGGPYLMILGLLHDTSTYLNGLGYLILYNLIFILPLAVILAIASNKNLLEKVQTWKKQETGNMRLWGGLAMVTLGAFMFLF